MCGECSPEASSEEKSNMWGTFQPQHQLFISSMYQTQHEGWGGEKLKLKCVECGEMKCHLFALLTKSREKFFDFSCAPFSSLCAIIDPWRQLQHEFSPWRTRNDLKSKFNISACFCHFHISLFIFMCCRIHSHRRHQREKVSHHHVSRKIFSILYFSHFSHFLFTLPSAVRKLKLFPLARELKFLVVFVTASLSSPRSVMIAIPHAKCHISIFIAFIIKKKKASEHCHENVFILLLFFLAILWLYSTSLNSGVETRVRVFKDENLCPETLPEEEKRERESISSLRISKHWTERPKKVGGAWEHKNSMLQH